MKIKLAFFLFAFVLCTGSLFSQTEQTLVQAKVDVVYLASDYLEGRETGKPGEKLAAEYISARFADLGLMPMGQGDSWYHPFDAKTNANPHVENSGEIRKGINVVGFMDNKAAKTIVIGAHYDHLGMGHFGSRHVGDEMIHNGADDNASGVAAMLYIAEYLAKSNLKNNNYLYIAFSGEEMGLYGSKAYVATPTIDLSTINFMMNMDMVGRLNKEKVLSVSGTGTSPVWDALIKKIDVAGIEPSMKPDGIGPSDHTSFYLKDIPVLHFFTGQHQDYHKPSDDSNLINFKGILDVSDFMLEIIKQTNDQEKLAFTKTKSTDDKKVSAFKVTLGIMPDYVYNGKGMRIDAVIGDRPAEKAGMKGGDVIVQMGDIEVKDIYGYMEGLGKFEKGQKAKVTVVRDGKRLVKKVEF